MGIPYLWKPTWGLTAWISMLEVDGAIEMKKRLAPMKDGDFSQNHDGKNDFK